MNGDQSPFCTSISAEIHDPFSHFSPPHRIKEVITLLMIEAVNKCGVVVGAGKSLTVWPAGSKGSRGLSPTCPWLGSTGISAPVPRQGPL